jgi:uncharacterized protein YqeY
MSEEELANAVKAIIDLVGAKTPVDLGKVMSAAMKELSGKADGKRDLG